MPTPSWDIHGQYYETCSCDFLCPCVPGQMTVRPTQGSCTVAMAFQIDAGSFGSVSLDGLGFIVLAFTNRFTPFSICANSGEFNLPRSMYVLYACVLAS